MTTKSALATWDITIPKGVLTPELLKDDLSRVARQWAFQLERGEETGYEHWQCRVALKERTRSPWKVTAFPGQHYTPTSTAGVGSKFSYVMKTETRVLGPWTDKDEEVFLTDEVAEMTTLRPWQQKIVDSGKNPDARTVHILLDPVGGQGKSSLAAYIEYHQLGIAIEVMDSLKDMMRQVMDQPKRKLYVIDMPRALDKRRLGTFYSSIEQIKNGVAYDDRYKFKKERFARPAVWVFTNMMPDTSMLSKDRWRIWGFEGHDLVEIKY